MSAALKAPLPVSCPHMLCPLRCCAVLCCCAAPHRKDGQDVGLLPIAIELADRETINGSKGVVYSRSQLGKDKKEVLWRLAKAVFK